MNLTDIIRALYKTYKSLRKQGNTTGVAKAKADYDIAKRHAKHKVWFSKLAASVETFKARGVTSIELLDR